MIPRLTWAACWDGYWFKSTTRAIVTSEYIIKRVSFQHCASKPKLTNVTFRNGFPANINPVQCIFKRNKANIWHPHVVKPCQSCSHHALGERPPSVLPHPVVLTPATARKSHGATLETYRGEPRIHELYRFTYQKWTTLGNSHTSCIYINIIYHISYIYIQEKNIYIYIYTHTIYIYTLKSYHVCMYAKKQYINPY